MRALRLLQPPQKLMRGPDVRNWQTFLIGQGFNPHGADGVFGQASHDATVEFQKKHGLTADGLVGNVTLQKAMGMGLEVVRLDDDSLLGQNWPAEPGFRPLTGTAARQQVFGRFDFRHKPVSGNFENIEILGDWRAKNIRAVKIPQLAGKRRAPASGTVHFHKLATDQLVALWNAWEREGVMKCLETYDGDFVPRFIRGGAARKALSNHAFGTAFDINADTNPLGTLPARVGSKGCLRDMVAIAHQHGFYWGGHFSGRRDGMHFEVAKLM